jgi:hypothetical protein
LKDESFNFIALNKEEKSKALGFSKVVVENGDSIVHVLRIC